ncbi:SPFH domain-containing protein [Patescibacteria group bacterium]
MSYALYFISFIEIVFIIVIILPLTIYFFGKKDFFFTIIKEKTAKALMRFGKLHRILGYKEDDDGYLIEEKNIIKKWLNKNTGGLHWIGIPGINKIYKFKRGGLSYKQVPNEKGQIVPKFKEEEEKEYDCISLKDNLYYAIIQNAETSDMVPVNIHFQLTFRIVNVRKALFEVEDWVEMSLNQFKPILRDWIATKKIEDLIGAPGKTNGKEIIKKIGEEAKEVIDKSDINKRLYKNYGIELDKEGYGIALIDPSGTRGEKYMEELTKEWAATKEAGRMRIVYDELKKSGTVGQFARFLEALEKTSENPNKTIIFPLGSIQDMLRGWTGLSMEKEK